MTQDGSQPDGSAPLNRRDVLRLGAASFGVPLIGLPTTPHAAAGPPPQGKSEATPMSEFPAWKDFPAWEGETYPDHPDPRARTVNNLMFMGLGMHNFAAVHGGQFPAAAIRKGRKASLSWRVAILPYIEQFALYEKFHLDEAWDSPHNVSLLEEMPRVYASVAPRETATYTTHYQWIVGPGSLFGGDDLVMTDVSVCGRPTLMIVEASGSVPWTKPEDLTYDDAKPSFRLGGPFEGGSYATFADGSVRFLSNAHSPETLRALITKRPPSGRDRR
jgi:hypothetical protein